MTDKSDERKAQLTDDEIAAIERALRRNAWSEGGRASEAVWRAAREYERAVLATAPAEPQNGVIMTTTASEYAYPERKTPAPPKDGEVAAHRDMAPAPQLRSGPSQEGSGGAVAALIERIRAAGDFNRYELFMLANEAADALARLSRDNADMQHDITRLYASLQAEVNAPDARLSAPVPRSGYVEVMIETLRSFAKAYPRDAFPPITDEERERLGPGIITRASAMMGRHFAKFASEAADLLESAAAPVPDKPKMHCRDCASWIEGMHYAHCPQLKAQQPIPTLVDRFLSWRLPDSVRSDDCATVQGYPNRVGTNLLTADEARQMFEYLFAAASVPAREWIPQRLSLLEDAIAETLKRYAGTPCATFLAGAIAPFGKPTEQDIEWAKSRE